MKNVVKLLLVAVVVFSASSLFAQYAQPVTPFPFLEGPTADIAPQCVGGIVYDDNTWENGYGWAATVTDGRTVQKMRPPSYPFTINQVCLALTRLSSGSANWTFDIVVYDTTGTGGGPGTLVTTLASQVAVNVGTWPAVTWHDFTNITTIPQLTSGSYYIGIKWNAATQGNHFIGANETSTSPVWPVWAWTNAGPWANMTTYFPNCRSMGIRADGTGIVYAHNISVGPFLSLPTSFSAGTQYAIKGKVQNIGTSNETAVPIKFFVNTTQANTTNINLNAGVADSVSFNWTPADTGNFTLSIVSALSNDEYRANDTVRTIVHVYPQGTVLNCVGTGTTSVQYPFYTFYMDSRTDLLYTAAELGVGAGYIKRLGFNVIAPQSQVMNGFKVKMQNTTATSITAFTSTGWTDVFSANYTVPGSGWQYIDLAGAGFSYNGTNLLIEICFNNSSYTSSTTVNSSAATNRVVHQHSDLSSGDGCVDITTPGSGYTTLPNICILTVVGSNNPGSQVPNVYSLSQNYPNPFNPTTTINYTIPKSSMVRLVVYDILGREVMTLVNESLQAGSYNISFDASSLSSGVYMYKIQAGDFTDTKKMLLVK